jgi:hypothetical protein
MGFVMLPRCTLGFTTLACLLLAGCASKPLQSVWVDETFDAKPMQRILVIGVSASIAGRRTFEEQFAQALTDAGTPGLPGFQFIDEAAMTNNEAFNAGVAKSAADGLLLVRLLGVDTRTQVTTTQRPARSGSSFGPRGTWAPGWGPAWYSVPDIRQFQVAHVEATLFETKTHNPVWTATTELIRPQSVAAETPRFARSVIRDLTERGFIAKK